MGTISSNLSLNELSASDQLTAITGDAIAVESCGLSSGYVYYGYPGYPWRQEPVQNYGQPLFVDNINAIAQITETINKALHNKIVDEPEIPKWTGFIEI